MGGGGLARHGSPTFRHAAFHAIGRPSSHSFGGRQGFAGFTPTDFILAPSAAGYFIDCRV